MIDFLSSPRMQLAARAVIVFAFLGCLSEPSQAKYGPDDETETLDAQRPKAEQEAPLPPFPVLTNLLPVDTGPTSKQSFAIDPQSLTIAEEYIVRYTVVATSSSGTKNISYEGINCMSLDFKRYAYGTKDGKWVRTRANQWEKVSSMSQNQLHVTLTRFFFCRDGYPADSTKDILERVRNNRPLSD